MNSLDRTAVVRELKQSKKAKTLSVNKYVRKSERKMREKSARKRRMCGELKEGEILNKKK